MRISILTGCFYPQIHPRAFRATELADEFKRMGHEVSVINLRIIEGFDYKVFEKEHGYEVHNYNVYKGDGVVRLAANASSQSLLGRIKRFAIDYFLCGHLFKYGFEIKNLLKGYNDDETDDPCALGAVSRDSVVSSIRVRNKSSLRREIDSIFPDQGNIHQWNPVGSL